MATTTEFKGKTYICFIEGKFDEHPEAASTFKVTFDRTGTKGTARSLLVYEKSDQFVLQQSLTFHCGELDTGQKYFDVKVGLVDSGLLFYKSFAEGDRVWIEHNIPGRALKGWMLRLPANPAGIDLTGNNLT